MESEKFSFMLLTFGGVGREEMLTCYVEINYSRDENIPCCVSIKKEKSFADFKGISYFCNQSR